MRICFMGTPDFAIPSLQALIDRKQDEVVAVFTQPDKKVGRKQVLTPPPVKVLAETYNIPVYQPVKIKDKEWVDVYRKCQPDLCVTAAFGQILSQEILDVPQKGTINVHGSLLPKYRGPAPIQWCIINGERETGVTTMYTDAGIDTGDMLLGEKTVIGEKETAGELFDRLAQLGAKVLLRTLDQLDTLTPVPQDERQASYYPMIQKEMAKLDFTKTMEEIDGLVRGMNPWPVAHFVWQNQNYKVYTVQKLPGLRGECGQVLSWSQKEGIVIGCRNGAVRLTTLQAPGKKAMADTAFANGFTLPAGTNL